MTEAERIPSPHAPFFAIVVLVALLMWLCSCEKERKYRKLKNEVDSLTEVRINQLEGSKEWFNRMNTELDTVRILLDKLHKENKWIDSVYRANNK